MPELLSAATCCRAWRDVSASRALWQQTPLPLAARVMRRTKLTARRSRGTVYRGLLLGCPRRDVALRVYDQRLSNASHFDGLLPSLVRELSFLRALEHPNLVRFLGAEIKEHLVFVATVPWPSSSEAHTYA